MTDICLQLKGSVVTTFILEVYRYSLKEFSLQLEDKINQAPAFFYQSSIVISLDKVEQNVPAIDLLELLAVCRRLALQPMAFRCSDSRFLNAINETGLALISDTALRSLVKKPLDQESTDEKNSLDTHTVAERKSRVITRPVRSGQQIYAQGGDLIIMSQVSEGAEVLADGHIHVYGSLRGRALAGVKGDTDARVFCQKMEAELISIAGNFILSDILREKVWKQPAQVYLDEQSLHVEAV